MDDVKIVDMLFMRSEKALEELSLKYSALCASVMRRLLDNESDIDECVNDVRLAVWNSIPPNRPYDLPAYLSVLSRNAAINRLKYNKRKKRSGDLTVMLSELDDCIAYSEDDPIDALERERLKKVISDFLADTDARTRVLFIRRYVYLESASEMAERFGISENAINVKLFRTRKKLKKILLQEGFSV